MRSAFKLGTFLSLVVAAAMASCGSDESAPPASGTCGNGVVEQGEMCDGQQLNGATCASATSGAMANGNVTCDPTTCQLVTAACTGGVGGAGGGMNP